MGNLHQPLASSSKEKGERTQSPSSLEEELGWSVSARLNATLKQRAKDMRNNPTAPEKRLWWHLSASKLDGHKFRRQAVIGPYIADFLCPQKKLVVEVDGETHDLDKDAQRDADLRAAGYTVFRVTYEDVLKYMDAVLQSIAAKIESVPDRWPSPHPNPSPEGEGLMEMPQC